MVIANRLLREVVVRKKGGHRQATWLELFFDLAFVISIAALTAMLVKDHTLKGMLLYGGLFLAVYWAWNQLTWYSALFDNGDVFFRIMYLGSILSVLILAAAVGRIAQGTTTLFVVSYVLLQAFLFAGWLRVHIKRHELRRFSLIYILGQVSGSVIWCVSLALPFPQQCYLWIVAVLIHIAAPYFAWKTNVEIPVHTSHIVERYCLLTIIILGETFVAVSIGLKHAPDSGTFLTAILGYVIVACIWWTYFNWDFGRERRLETFSNVFAFGYGHFVVFVAIAAFGAGIDIAIHAAAHGGHSTLLERALLALPPSIYLLSLSLLNRFSWNMAFGRKMRARVLVAALSLVFAFATRDASPAVLTGGITFLLTFLVGFELLCCDTSTD